MTTSQTVLDAAATLSLGLLSIALLITVFRIVSGPTLTDRILALDLLVFVAISFIAAFAIKTGVALYVDIAVALALFAFLATVAFSRFILKLSSKSEQRSFTNGDHFVE